MEDSNYRKKYVEVLSKTELDFEFIENDKIKIFVDSFEILQSLMAEYYLYKADQLAEHNRRRNNPNEE